MTTIPSLASLGVVLRKGTYFPKFCRVELLPMPKGCKLRDKCGSTVVYHVDGQAKGARRITAITLGRSGSELPSWQQSDTVKVCEEGAKNGENYCGNYPYTYFKLIEKPKIASLCDHPNETIRCEARLVVLKKRLKTERLCCQYIGDSGSSYRKVPSNSRVAILKVGYNDVQIQLLSGDARSDVNPNELKWDSIEKLDLNSALTASESVRNTCTSPVLVPLNRLVEVGKDNLKRATWGIEAVERKWKRIAKTKNHMKHLRKHSADYELVEKVLLECVDNSDVPVAIAKINAAMSELTEALSKYPLKVALRIHEEMEKVLAKGK